MSENDHVMPWIYHKTKIENKPLVWRTLKQKIVTFQCLQRIQVHYHNTRIQWIRQCAQLILVCSIADGGRMYCVSYGVLTSDFLNCKFKNEAGIYATKQEMNHGITT